MNNHKARTLYINRPYHSPGYRITDADAVLRKTLLTQYGAYIAESAAETPDAYEIIVTREGESYKITHNNAETITPSPLFEIEDIIHETTAYSDSILALHGAAVEWRGQAYIFLAPTTGGKTTLASYLVHNGFGYVTDDCILIDRADFRVHPYPRPVHLRRGGLDVLKNCGAAPEEAVHFTDNIQDRFVFNPANPVKNPVPLGGIYFINRSESENALVEMNANERITELMRSPIHAYEVTGGYIKLISALAKTPCHRLVYRDMDFVKEAIIRAGGGNG